ncbi:MAG TPA: TonB-dependent receptor [Bryobacteraceae bacterium]|nr:TonB-dependent receptor [Bryobacteraceae bacterium]
MREHKYQFADNLTWIRGRHTMKFGFDVRELRLEDYENFIGSDNFGNYYFNGNFTGYDFADFLLGLPSHTEVVNAGPDFDGHERAYGFFAQDSVKVTPKLSVDFGVRYEYHPPFHDNSLQITNFDRANGNVIVPNAKSLALAAPGFLQSINACSLPTPNPTPYGLYPCTKVEAAADDGVPASLRFSDKNDVMPRLSFAYRLSDKTVIRAGAGMYNETLLGQMFYSLTGVHTSDYRAFPNSITNGVAAIQFPNTKSAVSSNGASAAGNASFGTANQITLRDPYATQWSFTVERELGAQTGLRVTYTGMRSIGLPISPDLNQIPAQSTPYDPRERPYPNWAVIKTRDNGGTAIYNALETVVTHRYSSGVFLQSSYVWAKNLSDAQGDNPSGFSGENGPRVTDRFNIRGDYGDVAFTRRHRWLTTVTIDLPVGRGKRFGANMSQLADFIVGGWRTTHILLFQTGPYLTPYYAGGNDPSGTNAPNRPGTLRPDRLPASACSGLTANQGQVFDNNCFFYGWPGPIGRFGNSGVGILTGPGTAMWSAGLSKIFPISEQFKLRFESTFTNLPNHVNFGNPNMVANSGAFGVISGVQNPDGASARTVQFALRLDF